MASRFLMQIVDRNTKETVSFEPGKRIEVEFVDDCVSRVLRQAPFTLTSSSSAFVDACVVAAMKRGVAFKPGPHVEQDLRDALYEVIVSGGFDEEVKAVQDGLGARVRIAIEGAILALKTQVVP